MQIVHFSMNLDQKASLVAMHTVGNVDALNLHKEALGNVDNGALASVEEEAYTSALL